MLLGEIYAIKNKILYFYGGQNFIADAVILWYYNLMKYNEKRDFQNNKYLNERVMPNLPSFCNAFFVGIEQKTTPLTRLGYARDLEIFFQYLTHESANFCGRDVASLEKEDLNQITIDDLEQYMAYLTQYQKDEKQRLNGERGKMRKMATLRSFFKYFYRRGDLQENIMTKVDLPKVHDKSIIRLNDDEVTKLINAAAKNPRDEMIVTLFLLSGIRVSELVGLDYEDIDLDNKTFLVTRKGGKQTILHMGDQLHDKFAAYFQTGEFTKGTPLFTKCGHRLSVRAVENIVKKYAQTAAPLKKISPHKLRSTYGTNLYKATGDIYVVADVLGHRDINTTKKHYAAISDDIRIKAANKVKL